jgi:superfamily I DNA and/or RNA helicase
LVCKPEHVPTGIDGVTVLPLNNDNMSAWRTYLAKEKTNLVRHIFCTVGQTLSPGANYPKALDLFNGAFDFVVVDEAGQVLEINGNHLGKFAAQLLLAGDVAQIPAFAHLPDEHHTLMRAGATTVTPAFLNMQRRMNEGLGAVASCLSYNGKVGDALAAIPSAKSLHFF